MVTRRHVEKRTARSCSPLCCYDYVAQGAPTTRWIYVAPLAYILASSLRLRRTPGIHLVNNVLCSSFGSNSSLHAANCVQPARNPNQYCQRIDFAKFLGNFNPVLITSHKMASLI
ncbi:hypothetical protein CEXT_482971 [Caerostris extrusa]|uniref:Uncharacterized protein n=1 Tax=Caerostris extrusa TaxID=172846 RepID=A0AAV4V9Y2_CAEEX|nr:hypothetical protein CEXT_482971 [Caerostris extrusa]